MRLDLDLMGFTSRRVMFPVYMARKAHAETPVSARDENGNRRESGPTSPRRGGVGSGDLLRTFSPCRWLRFPVGNSWEDG